MSDYAGRGAWSPIGGTLAPLAGTRTTGRGKYYMRPSKGVLAPGVAADKVLLAGGTPDLNEHAVWFGVLAIKTRLQEMTSLVAARTLILNGRYGHQCAQAVQEFQGSHGLTADGIVGPITARVLFGPVVAETGSRYQIGPRVGVGLVANESGWDPGAVGSVDSDDWGIAQLNTVHQGVTRTEAFIVRSAVERLYGLMDRNLRYFHGAEADAIAAYNLGRTGAELWISEGRQQWFVPKSARSDPQAKPRDVWAYIDRIRFYT